MLPACLAQAAQPKDDVVKLSARNQLRGTIGVVKRANTSQLTMIKSKATIAFIKASDVMVGVD